LEARRRLEVGALLAAVQGHTALRANTIEIRVSGKDRGTVEAARGGDGLHEAGKAGAGDVNGQARALRRSWPVVARTIATVVVLIPPLSVLAITFHRDSLLKC
jgi:hypothetical protein